MKKPPLSLPEFIALFGLMTSLTALSIDAMLPALPRIGQTLSVADAKDTQLIISMFIFGMVFGELIFGPLSDAIGRKKAIVIGIVVYCFGAVFAMTAQSIEQLLLGRIIQGVGVSGPKIGSRALIRDQYEGNAMARVMSFIMTILILVPMLAPAFGQFVLVFADWRAIFFSFLGLAIVLAVWLSWRQPETLAVERRIPFSIRSVLLSTGLVIRHVRVMAYTFSAGLLFGALLLYYGTAQAIFQDLYHTGEYFPLYFALLALGIGAASLLNSRLVMHYGMYRLAVAALVGLLVFGSILLLLALTQQGIPVFQGFIIFCFLMFFCVGILFGNLNAMAMQPLGRVAGLGASLIASISSLVAVVLAVSVGRFYNDTIIPLVSGFLLAATIALVLILLAERTKAGSI